MEPITESTFNSANVNSSDANESKGNDDRGTFTSSSQNPDNPLDSLHPLELVAFGLFNGSLDNLSGNFEQLGQSQYILLTRLKLLEERLNRFKVILQDKNYIDSKEILAVSERVKDLRKRIGTNLKSLEKIKIRMDNIEKD